MMHKLNKGERIACLTLYSELSQKPSFYAGGQTAKSPPPGLTYCLF